MLFLFLVDVIPYVGSGCASSAEVDIVSYVFLISHNLLFFFRQSDETQRTVTSDPRPLKMSGRRRDPCSKPIFSRWIRSAIQQLGDTGVTMLAKKIIDELAVSLQAHPHVGPDDRNNAPSNHDDTPWKPGRSHQVRYVCPLPRHPNF